ncbi:MAG TPA: DUF1573 domain-containing protein [Kiritimatiellia bacterium]|nr:DUF1573 domain-containing protein [Kiritimatiellia bacterium]
MNKWFLIYPALVATALLPVMAEESGEQPVPRGPSIICDEPDFNFGAVDSQAVIEHTFVFRNIGDTTLEIQQARPACGCTVAEITERNVPPGGESRITAKLSMQGRTGHQSKGITIVSNDPEKPQYRVTMSGVGHSAMRVTPERLIIGQLRPGQESIYQIEIASMSEQTFNILEVASSSANFQGNFETVEAGKTYRLNIVATAPGTPGPLNAALRVMTDHPNRQAIDIPISANVVGELIYAPAELVLPASMSVDAPPLTRYVVVRPGSSTTFEITNVTLPNREMRANIFPFGNQGYRVQLENIVPTADLDGQFVVLETTAEFMSEIRIPVRINQ